MGKTDSINPLAVEADRLAQLLTAASGSPVTKDMVQAALEAGAPVTNGKVNLVNLLAWLEGQLTGKSS